MFWGISLNENARFECGKNTGIDTRFSKITIFFFSFSLIYHLKRGVVCHPCRLLSISSSRGRCEDDDLRVSRILQNYPWYLFFCLFFSFRYFFPHLFAQKMQIVFHDFCITAILLSTITTTKVLVVHSLSPATEVAKITTLECLMTQVI